MTFKKISLFLVVLLTLLLTSCENEGQQLNEYIINFIGHNNETIEIFLVKENEKINYPETPIIEGYEFVGWDKNLEYADSDITINALYEKLVYTVNFYDINDNIISSQEVEYNDSAVAPNAPIVEGYEFTGWNTKFNKVKKNLDVKPLYNKLSYEELTYTVKFYDLNNNIITEKQVKHGERAIAPNPPIIEGYEFVGWDLDFSSVTCDLNIKPQYKLNKYIVKFYDANNNVISEQEILYGQSAIAPNTPSKVGHTFEKWDTNFYNVHSNLDIRPILKINTYIVKFYDAYNNVISSQKIEFGSSAIAPNTPTKEGHIFTSWDQIFNCVTSNLDIRPIFNVNNNNNNKFTVKFYDANNNVISTQEVEYGKAAISPIAPTKNGYTFVSWDQSFNCVTSNLDIKPIFTINNIVNTFTVKFYDANNNVISTQTVKQGDSAVEPKQPTKTGYTFNGWSCEFDYVTSNLDVYPVFKQNAVVDNTTYTVTFLDNKGNTLLTTTVKKGASATAPTPPTVNFYKFVKWDTDFSNVTSNLTIKPIYEKIYASYSISNVNYWLQILTDKYDLQEELLSRTEIDAYNQTILSDYSKTKVVDVTKINSSATGTYVTGLINNYTNINKYTIYNYSTKAAISTTEKNTILNNRALSNISSTVTVKYGIIVNFAWVRSYPTNHYSNDYYMDRFQETSLYVGEAVAIYHISSDGNWYFVQAQNYNGWVEKKNIAECSYNEMISFLNPTERLVVISNFETIEGAHVRMGQSFPLLSQGANYQISFPTRSSSGTLVLKNITLTNKNSYSVGYLPYTYENIFTQAFKLLGINYSWGDKELDGRDCSSTMNAVYHCFGFKMPRNTSNQVNIPTYSTKMSGITSIVMKTYEPGTLIYTSSHVMMYIGENENGVSYLLHNTTSGNGECILQSLDSYGGSKIIGTLKLQ